MKIVRTAPITIQPWPLPVTEPGNGGIVPPWLVPTPPTVPPAHNGNPGIVPPWLQ